MKCPVCGTEISDNDKICPNCKIQIRDNNNSDNDINKEEKDNADKLEFWANFNIVLIVIGAITSVIINLINYNSEENFWINMIIPISLLLFGFTFYRLLLTIVDIYNKLD